MQLASLMAGGASNRLFPVRRALADLVFEILSHREAGANCSGAAVWQFGGAFVSTCCRHGRRPSYRSGMFDKRSALPLVLGV